MDREVRRIQGIVEIIGRTFHCPNCKKEAESKDLFLGIFKGDKENFVHLFLKCTKCGNYNDILKNEYAANEQGEIGGRVEIMRSVLRCPQCGAKARNHALYLGAQSDDSYVHLLLRCEWCENGYEGPACVMLRGAYV